MDNQLAAELAVPPAVALIAALLTGFVIAGILRLLFPQVRTLGWSTSTLLALVGGAVGATAAHAIWPERILFAVLLAFGATLLLLLIGTAISQRIQPTVPVHGIAAQELLRLGESEWVEFKSSARRNLHTGERDPAIEHVVAKTVCGFLNGRGGTLLIGVNDDAEVLGLEGDLVFMHRDDLDSFELFLTTLFSTTLGLPATSDIEVRFVRPGAESTELPMPSEAVCRVDVFPSPVPVYLTPTKGPKEPEFWVRSGNATRRLRIDELLDYHSRRWRGALSQFTSPSI